MSPDVTEPGYRGGLRSAGSRFFPYHALRSVGTTLSPSTQPAQTPEPSRSRIGSYDCPPSIFTQPVEPDFPVGDRVVTMCSVIQRYHTQEVPVSETVAKCPPSASAVPSTTTIPSAAEPIGHTGDLA